MPGGTDNKKSRYKQKYITCQNFLWELESIFNTSLVFWGQDGSNERFYLCFIWNIRVEEIFISRYSLWIFLLKNNTEFSQTCFPRLWWGWGQRGSTWGECKLHLHDWDHTDSLQSEGNINLLSNNSRSSISPP